MSKNMKQVMKLDSAETLWFEKELAHVEAKQFEVKYAPTKARSLLPVKYISPGKTSYEWHQFDSVGEANRISDYAKDFKTVNLKGEKFVSGVESYGAAFQYSIQEIRGAREGGRNLDADKATVARKVIEQKLDRVAALGDSDASLLGLTTLTGCNDYDPTADGAGSAKTFASKDGTKVLNDIINMLEKAPNATNGAESMQNRLIFPVAQFNMIKRLGLTSADPGMTVWKFLKEHYPQIEIMSWARLTGAGAGATDLAICYEASEEKLALIMAVDYEQVEPEKRGMAYKVACHARTGGVVNFYPKSVTYMDGI